MGPFEVVVHSCRGADAAPSPLRLATVVDPVVAAQPVVDVFVIIIVVVIVVVVVVQALVSISIIFIVVFFNVIGFVIFFNLGFGDATPNRVCSESGRWMKM